LYHVWYYVIATLSVIISECRRLW